MANREERAAIAALPDTREVREWLDRYSGSPCAICGFRTKNQTYCEPFDGWTCEPCAEKMYRGVSEVVERIRNGEM